MSVGALQIAEERSEAKRKGETDIYQYISVYYIYPKAEFHRIARRDKKAFLKWTMQRSRGI